MLHLSVIISKETPIVLAIGLTELLDTTGSETTQVISISQVNIISSHGSLEALKINEDYYLPLRIYDYEGNEITKDINDHAYNLFLVEQERDWDVLAKEQEDDRWYADHGI